MGLFDDWRVYKELSGNLIRLYSLHPSFCVYWSVRELLCVVWALSVWVRVFHRISTIELLRSRPGGRQAQPHCRYWCGKGDESSARCGAQTTCGMLSFGLSCSCASCLSGMRPSWALCEFLGIVWDSDRLTSLCCRGPAPCLQVNTEETGLVHTHTCHALVPCLIWE